MQLAGKQVLNATSVTVWQMLMNTDTLAKVVPGVSRLERLSENSYKSVLAIKLGPVSSTFSGNLQLEDIVEQKSFTLKVQQDSKIGNANAIIKIHLSAIDENKTEVEFDGNAKLSGLLASMGQRVLGGVANTLTKQFFKNMEKELSAHPMASKGET